MTSTDTVRPSERRSLLRTVSQWLDNYSLWSMNSAETLAARESILAQAWTRSSEQWSRSDDEDAVAREMAR